MKTEVFLCFLFVAVLCHALPDVPELDFEQAKERCDKKGGNGTFDKIKIARDKSQDCLHELIDIDTFNNELNASMKTGSMDDVFSKYCKKRPQMMACGKILYDSFEPCLEEEEKKVANLTVSILSELGDFACAKDGDRLALFVAEGGVECIKSRSEGIQNCFNQTLQFNPDTFSSGTISKLVSDKKPCDELTKIQNCVVADLEKCEETTPANIIDAVFKFIKKRICKNN